MIVWVVGDGTANGSETGTSFRQALYFKDECGLNIHDTMIYQKNNFKPLTHNRYEQAFEYMFVFSKGPVTVFNPIKDKPNKYHGATFHGTFRDVDGTTKTHSGHNKKKIAEFGMRHNIWPYNSQGKRGTKHPATFPLQLAVDHVVSWSNLGEIVLDPFAGSGTTGEAAVTQGRNFVGIELNPEYALEAEQRLVDCVPELVI